MAFILVLPIFQDEMSEKVYKGFKFVNTFDEGVERVRNVPLTLDQLVYIMLLRLLRGLMLL